jgi:hypothetical protein
MKNTPTLNIMNNRIVNLFFENKIMSIDFFSFQYDDRLSMIKYLSFTNNVSSPINHFPPGFFLFAFRIQLMYIFSLHSLACRCIHLRIYRTREGKKRKENRL